MEGTPIQTESPRGCHSSQSQIIVSAQQSLQNSKRSPFLQLPTEIRLCIYRYHFQDAMDTLPFATEHLDELEQDGAIIRDSLTIFTVYRQMYEEATDFFYSTYRFPALINDFTVEMLGVHFGGTFHLEYDDEWSDKAMRPFASALSRIKLVDLVIHASCSIQDPHPLAEYSWMRYVHLVRGLRRQLDKCTSLQSINRIEAVC